MIYTGCLMIKIDFDLDIKEVTRGLDEFSRQCVPSAMALALTRTGQQVKEALVDEIRHSFDRPTPWTLNSLFMKEAKKNRLQSRVWVKDDAYKGIAPVKYLTPEIFGGKRSVKRFERALANKGLAEKGAKFVPGSGAKLDQYGNIGRGQIVQALAAVGAFGEEGYKANMTDKGRARLAKGNAKKGVRGVTYFAGAPGGGKLPFGIWQRTSFGKLGSAIRPIMLKIDEPNYHEEFDFFGVSRRVVNARLADEFAQALRDKQAWAG